MLPAPPQHPPTRPLTLQPFVQGEYLPHKEEGWRRRREEGPPRRRPTYASKDFDQGDPKISSVGGL